MVILKVEYQILLCAKAVDLKSREEFNGVPLSPGRKVSVMWLTVRNTQKSVRGWAQSRPPITPALEMWGRRTRHSGPALPTYPKCKVKLSYLMSYGG